METRQHYRVGLEDSLHTDDPPQGWAPKLCLIHARMPGPDGPIICKELIFTQKVMGGKRDEMGHGVHGMWGPNAILNTFIGRSSI